MVNVAIIDTAAGLEDVIAYETFASFDHATIGMAQVAMINNNPLYAQVLRMFCARTGDESFNFTHTCECGCESRVTVSYLV